jgi:predicted thioredoxin/glutaredoxin
VTTLTLIGKSGCHLCEVAHGVVDGVLANLPADEADRVQVVELSILEDEALHEVWWEKIPVVLIDGELHAQWRVAPDPLREALRAAVASAGD